MARSKKQTDPRAGIVLTLVEKGNYEKLIGVVQDLPKPEDVRPPPKLGSKMVLAVLALIESGFEPKDIRRVIRF